MIPVSTHCPADAQEAIRELCRERGILFVAVSAKPDGILNEVSPAQVGKYCRQRSVDGVVMYIRSENGLTRPTLICVHKTQRKVYIFNAATQSFPAACAAHLSGPVIQLKVLKLFKTFTLNHRPADTTVTGLPLLVSEATEFARAYSGGCPIGSCKNLRH